MSNPYGEQPGVPYQPQGGYPPVPPPAGYPSPPLAYPASAPPAYPGYPASAPPAYPGYPASAPPAYPASAPPGYPVPPGYPAPPGYPVPPGYPPQPKARSPWLVPLLIIGGAVLVVMIGAVAFVALRGNERDPGEVVTAYFEGVESGNFSLLLDITCGDLRQQIQDFMNENPGERPPFAPGDVSVHIDRVTVNGDRANVEFTVSYTIAGEPSTDSDDVDLRRVDGEWKLCDLS